MQPPHLVFPLLTVLLLCAFTSTSADVYISRRLQGNELAAGLAADSYGGDACCMECRRDGFESQHPS